MTEKVDVRFGLAFVQLINVNEKNQIMKSNVWLRLVSLPTTQIISTDLNFKLTNQALYTEVLKPCEL